MRAALNRLLFIVAMAVLAFPAVVRMANAAPEDQRIVAVVNDDVISAHDVNSRLALVLATTNVAPGPETRQRLAPQILRSLVDDSLKRQETRQQNIVVSRQEIDDALARIAQQAKMTPEQLTQVLAARGVGVATLIDQIETEIGWMKAVSRKGREQVRVNEDQIDEELNRINENAGKPEYRVAEIFLPFDAGVEEARVSDLAQKIVEQIRGGASFPELARNFSQGASAAVGGDLGWVREGQLAPQLDAAIAQLAPGQVSVPIRSEMGYHILAMIDGRISEGATGGNARVDLTQVHFALPPGASNEAVARQTEAARTATQGAIGCEAFNAIGKKTGSPLSGALGEVDLKQLPLALRRVVQPLKVGESSAPFRGADGIIVVMVCRRDEEAPQGDIRGRIEQSLREERISALAQRLLRDIRRTAYVDIRN